MTDKKVNFVVPILIIVLTLVFVFMYPRMLISQFGEASPWTSYLYLYGFGGYFFMIGLILILKTGACKLGRGRDTKFFAILCSGFIFLVCMHATWIYLALSIPVKGGVN